MLTRKDILEAKEALEKAPRIIDQAFYKEGEDWFKQTMTRDGDGNTEVRTDKIGASPLLDSLAQKWGDNG